MLESKWGLRFFALILAIFFYLSVNNVFGNIFNNDNLAQNSSKTIEDVPVEILYNTKNLHVTKSPDTVDVTISGPQLMLNLNTLISPWRIKILKQCMFSLIFHKTM